MELNISFANEAQRSVYYCTARNQCFSGGFNNGKTFIGCFKALTLLTTFANYRYIIARETYTNLKRTTMETFFKLCPPGLIASHNMQDGLTDFKNGSKIWWMHLDAVDEASLKGIEPDSILIDQAEETKEQTHLILDARVGRNDSAIIPQELLDTAGGNWPMNPKTGKYIAPSYMTLLCNPDNMFHYIYRKYHPDSDERDTDYAYYEGQWDPSLGSTETYLAALKHDPEWVAKYVKGGWGISESAIHLIYPDSVLKYTPELISRIKEKGNLFRVLDHGEASPTCCLWVAAIDGVYIFYREYYVASKVVSYHRKAIADLSESEYYSNNYADPQIFKKTNQKDGGFWSIAQEYTDSDIGGAPIHFLPADNNEFATRNRINELLIPSVRFAHPISKQRPAPGIYFIKHSIEYPYGCKESIRQLGSQRRKLLASIDGKNIYADDRDETITDHAYDPIRYFIAMHGTSPKKSRKAPPRNSLAYYDAVLRRKQSMGPQPNSLIM